MRHVVDDNSDSDGLGTMIMHQLSVLTKGERKQLENILETLDYELVVSSACSGSEMARVVLGSVARDLGVACRTTPFM